MDFKLNGRAVSFSGDPDMPLLWCLRDHQGLTGAKFGCGIGACGACTVLIDGRAMRSCVTPVSAIAGRSVTTIEGLAQGDRPHPLQQAFVDCHGLQCGFCTPGMIMSAACLLSTTPDPTDAQIAEALEGNLCRCTGYVNIVAAVRQAAGALQKEGQQ